MLLNGKPCRWAFEQQYLRLTSVQAQALVSVEYPLRELDEPVTCGGQSFQIRWNGDTVIRVDPPGLREPTYPCIVGQASRLSVGRPAHEVTLSTVPDTYSLQDACRLATLSMLARTDLLRDGQPFFMMSRPAKMRPPGTVAASSCRLSSIGK